MSVEIKEISFENYGKCLSIGNEFIQVIVTIDVGPRIVFFGRKAGPNLLFNDLNRKYVWQEEEFQNYFGENSRFYLYGGHRLWIAPEKYPESYIPDNVPVVYTLLSDGVRFTPPRSKYSEIQLSFEIIMSADTQDIMIVHCAENVSHERKQISLWGITAVQPGGTLILPQNKSCEEQTPNRSVVFWPYSNLQDPRLFMGNQYVVFRQGADGGSKFKMGLNNQSGWSAYLLGEYAFVKRFVHTHGIQYPDLNCSFEFYSNNELLELETLSPFCCLDPHEGVRHVENWSVIPVKAFDGHINQENQIEQYVRDNL